jgi:hypothetical protein
MRRRHPSSCGGSDSSNRVHSRFANLDGPADKDAASAWEAEILRRLGEIEAGTAKLIDREELRRRMRARISGV